MTDTKKDIQLDQSVSKDSTIERAFKITPAMIVWMDTSIENASESPTEISQISGIDKSTWYKWLKLEGFEDWYWSEYDKKMRRLKPLVDSLAVKFAKRGSDKHFEYLAERVGNLKESDTKTVVPVQVNNNFSDVEFVIDE